MSKSLKVSLTCLVFMACLFMAPSARAASVATVEATAMYDIYGRALSINDANEVLLLGSLDRTSGIQHPMIWKDGVTKEITEIGSQSDMVVVENPPNAFNNKSEFVGYISHTDTGTDQSFIYRNATGTLEYLDPYIEGTASSHVYAVAVNNNSQVLGYFTDTINCYRPFIWQDNAYSVISNSAFGCYTTVSDINDNGVITGYTYANGAGFGFILDTATNTLTRLADASSSSIQPKSINNLNQVVGTADYSKAFLYKGGVLSYLPGLGGSSSNAYSVNDAGEIVGDSYTTGDSQNHAVLWEAGVAVDLGTLAFDTPDTVSWGSTSLSINNSGLIVGTNFANDASGQLDTPVLYDYIITKERKPKKIKKNEGSSTALSAFTVKSSKKTAD